MIKQTKVSLAILLLMSLGACDRIVKPFCSIEPTEQSVQINEELKAFVVAVDCGATTGFTQWVVLQEDMNDRHFEENRVVSMEGDIQDLSWDGDVLRVYYHAERLYGGMTHFRGVSVEYIYVE